MRSLRRLSLLSTVVAVATLILLPPSSPTVAQQAPLPVIRFGAAADDNALPLLYAEKAGLYRRYGIDVELVKFTNAASATAALLGGSLDLSKNSALGLINAIVRGVPLTAIGSIGYYDANKPDYALLVSADSGVRNPTDLEGKTLAAISLQDMSSIATFGWLEQHGVDPAKVKYVELPAVATLAAIERGQVVGATMSEPFLSANVATGKVRVLGYPYSALGGKYSASVLFSTKQWAGDHPDLIDKFLRATQEASVYVGAHENAPELRDLIASYTGVDPTAIKSQRHPGRGVLLGPSDLQPVIDSAAKFHVIPKAFPAQEIICSCALR